MASHGSFVVNEIIRSLMLPTTHWKRKRKRQEEEEDMLDPLIDDGRLEWQTTLQNFKKPPNVAYIRRCAYRI